MILVSLLRRTHAWHGIVETMKSPLAMDVRGCQWCQVHKESVWCAWDKVLWLVLCCLEIFGRTAMLAGWLAVCLPVCLSVCVGLVPPLVPSSMFSCFNCEIILSFRGRLSVACDPPAVDHPGCPILSRLSRLSGVRLNGHGHLGIAKWRLVAMSSAQPSEITQHKRGLLFF